MSQLNGILHYSVIIFLCLVQMLSVMLFNAQSSTLFFLIISILMQNVCFILLYF